MAPEVLRGEPYDQKADMWGIGCVLYELATGKLAFGGNCFFQDIQKVSYILKSIIFEKPFITFLNI